MDAMHAFVFGFSLAIAIGPIALLIVHNGVNHGLRLAVLAALGAASADLIYAGLAFAVGSEVINALTAYEDFIRTSSALLLIAIGAWLVWKTLRFQTAGSETTAAHRTAPACFRARVRRA